MELLLEKTQYEKHNWSICGDLKSLQFSCLACSLATQRFDTFCVSGIVTDRKHHYIQKQWPKKEQLIPGQKTAITTLINAEKCYLPLLQIKFGLIKKFKAMDQNSAGCTYRRTPHIRPLLSGSLINRTDLALRVNLSRILQNWLALILPVITVQCYGF